MASTESSNIIHFIRFHEVSKMINWWVIEICDGFQTSHGRLSISDKEERLNRKLHILQQNQGNLSKEYFVCSDKKKDQKRESRYHYETCTRKL
ncbi:piggyBac transposable element-derived protein 4-like [Vespula maculifrons]|uniref:PiggyBac transposable element-derived protein 4-like n=1 Tax=Vespula maculifrons TaxID=7453 RepID=A0ABD2AZW2_VESMC